MKGLYGKYTVINNDTGEEVTDCFVLRPKKDMAARAALKAYARATEDIPLAEDILHWIIKLRSEE